MSSLQRQNDTLKRIIEKSSIKLICPRCLQGFPRSDSMYKHFQKQQDIIHNGLGMRSRDNDKFVECYQIALKSSIPSEKLPRDSKCFEVLFIVEHYGEGEYIPPVLNYSGPAAGEYVFTQCVQYSNRIDT